jgi:hypothetical protein
LNTFLIKGEPLLLKIDGKINENNPSYGMSFLTMRNKPIFVYPVKSLPSIIKKEDL